MLSSKKMTQVALYFCAMLSPLVHSLIFFDCESNNWSVVKLQNQGNNPGPVLQPVASCLIPHRVVCRL